MAWATLYGDLQCSHCQTIIVTPAGSNVTAGWGHCPCCRKSFKVDQFMAARANAGPQYAWDLYPPKHNAAPSDPPLPPGATPNRCPGANL